MTTIQGGESLDKPQKKGRKLMEPVKMVDPKEVYGKIAGNRWIQLICGVVSMIVISNFQYAFTLFTKGMQASWPDTPYKEIALIYTIFILFETWPVPLAGWLIDKFGIRRLMIVGAIGIGIGWTLGGTVAATPITTLLMVSSAAQALVSSTSPPSQTPLSGSPTSAVWLRDVRLQDSAAGRR